MNLSSGNLNVKRSENVFQYQFFMTEAILALYSANSWSFFHIFKTKRNIHWIIQIFASIFAIVGTICVYWGRPSHFATVHSVTGTINKNGMTQLFNILTHRFDFFDSCCNCCYQWTTCHLVI